MKKNVILLALALCGLVASAPAFGQKYVFTEASDLQITGKLFYDTPNPYHRVDTVKYKGFTKTENLQVRESSGLACAFRTNSTSISVKTEYATPTWPANTNGFSARGYDLYIRVGGEWQWAASGVAGDKKLGDNLVLIQDMDPVEHECLLYFPLYSEVKSVKIGVLEGSTIEGFVPFRHRVAIFGSSYTHGSSTSRSGLSYPAQFTRGTGIQMLSLGCSGNCKLQDYFCNVLCDVEADAFVFDAFSNPDAKMINERLFRFIEQLQAAQPGKPLIFQRTICRENRRFSHSKDYKEQKKWDMADSLMAIAVKKYPDVYYVNTTSAASKAYAPTVDGVHPDNYGYYLWYKSIEKPILRILRKYGIR